MILVRPVGMILPGAVATMSTSPQNDQASARTKKAMMVPAMARAAGEAGVSVISSAAGRKASSCARRRASARGNARMLSSADFMKPRLHAVQRRVAPALADELVVGAVLDDAATLDGDEAVGAAHRREAMRDDEDGATARHLSHILLDDALALVV